MPHRNTLDRARSALLLVTMAGPVTFAPAAEPPPAHAPGQSPGLLDRDRLTGDWLGLRPRLEDRGLTIDASYLAEFSGAAGGGINQRGSFRNLLTIDVHLDLAVAAGLSGGTVFAQFLSANANTGGSADSGDIQVYSNIEHDRSLDAIYELWYEQRFLDQRLRVKIGKIDANSEFAFVHAAGQFSHSSAGFSPTVFVFPSYPDPATGINLFATVIRTNTADLTLGYGFYDGAAGADGVATGRRGPSTFFSSGLSDDYFHIAQADFSWRRPGKARESDPGGRVAVGAWYHDGRFERFAGGTTTGTAGFFATAELHLFDPEHTAAGSGRGLYAFAQYGWADSRISEIAQHAGGGLVWRGPMASRPEDSIGLYASLAMLSDEPAAGFDRDELALDAYYCVHLTPAVFIQPEAQYIINPSGDASVDNALVLGLRIGLAF